MDLGEERRTVFIEPIEGSTLVMTAWISLSKVGCRASIHSKPFRCE
jgi:hypothetical protein